MRKTHTYKYRIEVRANVYMSDFGRDTKMNDEQLESFRREYNASFLPGGVNEVKSGIVPRISRCTMIRQSDNAIVSRAHAPLFEIA